MFQKYLNGCALFNSHYFSNKVVYVQILYVLVLMTIYVHATCFIGHSLLSMCVVQLSQSLKMALDDVDIFRDWFVALLTRLSYLGYIFIFPG